jgi:hypothetical protein
MTSRSSSSTSKKQQLISRTSKNLPLSAGVADQLAALEQFRARDASIKNMVTNVSKKAAAVADRGHQRQMVDQWIATFEHKLRNEVRAKEEDFSETWATVEDNLFEIMNFYHSSATPTSADQNGIMFLRRQMKTEGDTLKKMFEQCNNPSIVSTTSPTAVCDNAIRNFRMKQIQSKKSSNFEVEMLDFVSSLRSQQEEKIDELEKEIETLTLELSSTTTTTTTTQNQNIIVGVTWFLEQISSPKLSAISSEWFKSYDPLRSAAPQLFSVFAEHQESQQLVLDELARAASVTRDALLETASTRDIARFWDLWKSAPTLVPGGRSKRDRVISSAKSEISSFSSSVSECESILDLLLTLHTQKQQLRAKYSSALESIKEQMKRLDDVVVAFQALQEAEQVHATFLTQQEQEHSETKEREAKLRAEKERLEAQKAAEKAEEDAKEKQRLDILQEKQRKDAEEKQRAVAKWLEEKEEKQRIADEHAAEEEKQQMQIKKEQLEVAKERVRERAQIDHEKQAEKFEAQEALRLEQLEKEKRLQEFYEKQDERIGVQRDRERLVKNTASFAETAALPSVGESTAKFSRTGHGFSTDAIVRDARFKLHEALNVAGLSNTNYGRSVLRDTFQVKGNSGLAARSMAVSGKLF